MAKILIIDDDETIHLICRAYLTKAGHTIESAMDGPDGIVKAKEFVPDLILLDVNMPSMSGFDVAKKLKADPGTASTPIFMLTSLKQEANMERGYEMGIADYITKPTNITQLKLRIEKFLSAGK